MGVSMTTICEAGISFSNHIQNDFPQINSEEEASSYAKKIANNLLKIVYLERTIIGYKKDLILAQYGNNDVIAKQYQRRLNLYIFALNQAVEQTTNADKTFSEIKQIVVLMAEDTPDLIKKNQIDKILNEEINKLDEYSKKFKNDYGSYFYAGSIPIKK